MNQSILFPDLQDWESSSQMIVFTAQQQGINIECRIGITKLAALSKTNLIATDQDIATKALAMFETYRFDIEEEVEQLIEQEQFDELGRVIVT
ncbi:DUF1488 domain-containing protein [Shewanella sp.]|nr:DUF1488 domain-containing protein [Shewanella sp.]